MWAFRPYNSQTQAIFSMTFPVIKYRVRLSVCEKIFNKPFKVSYKIISNVTLRSVQYFERTVWKVILKIIEVFNIKAFTLRFWQMKSCITVVSRLYHGCITVVSRLYHGYITVLSRSCHGVMLLQRNHGCIMVHAAIMVESRLQGTVQCRVVFSQL